MANSVIFKLACAILLCMLVVTPHAEGAINCGIVSRNLAQCIAYLKGGPGPSNPCCGGVKTLASLAATSADRRTACGCLKSAAGAIRGLNYGKASGLAGKCGVRLPYAFSPSIDCSKVN